jgi:hypothetical protein
VYSLGTLFVSGIYVQIPCRNEMMMMMIIIIIIIIITIIIYLTANGLSPSGSGYYACT